MGADLNNIVKTQKLTDDHVQFLVYQLLRGLKVSKHTCSLMDGSSCTVVFSNSISQCSLQFRTFSLLFDCQIVNLKFCCRP